MAKATTDKPTEASKPAAVPAEVNDTKTNGVEQNATPKDKDVTARPEKPDEEKYRTDLAKAEKDVADSNERMKAVKQKIEKAQPNKNDSPGNQRRTELINQRNEIRQQQQTGKASRTQILDKIKRLDEQLKATTAEDKTARSKIKYKSTDEIQHEIDRLQGQVDTGTMKIVDEKKALSEVTSLNRLKKSFTTFGSTQQRIDDLRAQIAELRKNLDDPETKAMSDRYNAINTELDSMKSEQDGLYKNINALRDERKTIHEEQDQRWQALQKLRSDHRNAKRTYHDHQNKIWEERQVRQQAERQAYNNSKRKEIAAQKLEEASTPAYSSEIMTAQGLIHYLDPTSSEAKAPVAESKFAAHATRVVEDAPIKGTKLSKKDNDESDQLFPGMGGKKSKKQPKANKESSVTNGHHEKFNLSIGVIEDFARVGVEPPMNKGDVTKTVDALKEKIQNWRNDQDKKTKENIAKAQKEIDSLEEKDAQEQKNANGHVDSVGDVTDGVAATKIGNGEQNATTTV